MTTIAFKKIPSLEKILTGSEEILEIPAGSIVRVIYHPENNALDEYLIRTTDDENPFVGLDGGWLWGKSLENYRMELLPPGELTIRF
jgi:hypothetical protein